MPSKIQSRVSIPEATSGKVNVFNATSGQLAQGVYVTNAVQATPVDGARGVTIPQTRLIKFLPGNNEVDADDWAYAKTQPSVQAWLSSVDRVDGHGGIVHGRRLIEGKVDPRFTSTSDDLVVRMQAFKRATG